MNEPRCKNCGHLKIAHTIELICPKGELRQDEDGRQKIVWLGLLETKYESKNMAL
jgi:ribosomal protein L32